jgi:hypothetical protein
MHAVTGVVMLLALYLGGAPLGHAFDLTSASARIAAGVGQAKAYPGNNGAPIFIFEERHDSYTMALEESVSLIRLHKLYGLRDIGLEGFIKTATPFTWSQAPNPNAAMILLRKGEVNSAVFMAIGYGVSIHPIEVSTEYLTYSGDLFTSFSDYIWQIAMAGFKVKVASNALPPEIVAKFIQYQKTNDTKGMQTVILEQDIFAKQMADRLKSYADGTIYSISDDIAFLEGVRKTARSVGASVNSSSVSNLDNYIRFLNARQAASVTMASEIGNIASKGVPVVAAIIGAAHTSGIVAALTGEHRPVVVVSPMRAPVGGREILFTPDQMKAIYSREPIETDYVTRTLQNLARVKPKPNFDTPWLAAKAELYAKVDDLVKTFFGSGRGGGGTPPTTWSGASSDSSDFKSFLLAISEDRFEGTRVRIDRSRVELVNTALGTSIVFPVQIIGLLNNQVEQEFWARAGVAKGSHDIESDRVEEDILDQIKEGKGPDSAKNDIDEIDISKVTKMIMASTRAEVLKNDIFVN